MTCRFLFIILLHLGLSAHSSPKTVCEQLSRPEQNKAIQTIQPQDITCIGSTCYYTPQKVSASVIIRELPKVVFAKNRVILSPDEGFIATGRVDTEVSFWHACQEILNLMKERIRDLDQPVLDTGRKQVEIFVQFYNITESTYNEMSIGISGIYKGQVDGQPARGLVDTVSGVSSLSLAFGNLTSHILNARLSNAKNSSHASELSATKFLTPEGEHFSQNTTKQFYRDADFSSPAQEDGGYAVGGYAYVVEEKDGPYINIRDLSIRYSVPEKENEKVMLETNFISQQEIRIKSGMPHLVFSNTIEANQTGKTANFPFHYGKLKSNERTKFVVFISANVVNDSRPSFGHRLREISSYDRSELPNGSERTLADILRSAEFTHLPIDQNSFDVILMQLDPQLLDRNNYSRKVQVLVEGPGIKSSNEEIYEVQHLTLQPFQFPSVVGRKSTEPFTVRIRLYSPATGKQKKANSSYGFNEIVYTLYHYKEIGRVEIEDIELK